MRISALICTHNRLELLRRAVTSLHRAERPDGCDLDILVVANACTDGTLQWLGQHSALSASEEHIPLRWLEEVEPGKSGALNRAIPELRGNIVVLVDDDQTVDPGFLVALSRAAADNPPYSLFCCRILADWNGMEPAWAHDDGPYRIYPPPVPTLDKGPDIREVDRFERLPGGGALCLRREVFGRVGGFSPQLGPHGHDLGGAEDLDFVRRAMDAGERMLYVPGAIQYHYVDLERFRLRYLLRKSFARTRSMVHPDNANPSLPPAYIWRKLAEYLVMAVFSIYWPATRFYLVRVAATLGEIGAHLRPPSSERLQSQNER